MTDIDQVVELLRECSSILFITGAGLSADSGMPTYRGVGGLYDAAATEEDILIEDALSGEMMRAQPELTWKYLFQIADACRGCSFNRGHEVIAEMERRFDRVWTLTQNVDGFHRAAGCENVISIHGDLHTLYCPSCGWRETAELEAYDSGKAPRCPKCSAIIRPAVVLFGEYLPESKVRRLQRELDRGFDVVFSIGTSSLFPYIAEPMRQAVATGRPAIEINPERTEVSALATIRLPMRAADALVEILRRLS